MQRLASQPERRRRDALQLLRRSLRGRDDDHALGREARYDRLDGRRQIAVRADDERGIERIVVCVPKELNRDVHVSHLFLVGHPRGTALLALLRLWEVVPVVDAGQRARLDCFEPRSLPPVLVGITRVRGDSGCEVLHRHQCLVPLQQVDEQKVRIEPVITAPPFGSQAEVQVEAIHVSDNAFRISQFRLGVA